MRFISKSAKFSLQIRPQIIEAYAAGTQRVTQEAIYCDFQTNQLRDDEYEFACKRFDFDGGFQNQDQVTMTDPVYRLSVYDTDEAARQGGWPAELKAHVEEKLIHHSENYTDIIRVPVKEIPPPWPRYDEYAGTPSALVRKLVDEGHDLTEVLAYEQSHQARPAVIEQIEQTLQEIDEAEVVEEVIA